MFFKPKRLFISFAWSFLLLLVSTANALAYIDPGTGSYFLQMLIAGILGGLFAIKMFWGKIKAFFLKIMGKNSKSDE